MRCPNCKEVISDKATFCPKCGTKITVKNEVVEEKIKKTPKSKEKNLQKKKRNKKKNKINPILVGVGILCLCLIIVVFMGIKIYREHQLYKDQIALAREYENNNNDEEALVGYGMAAHTKPEKAEPFIKMADIYQKQKQYEKAATILNVAKKSTKKEEKKKIDKKIKALQNSKGKEIISNQVAIPEYTNAEDINADDIIKVVKAINKNENGKNNRNATYSNGWIYYCCYNQILRIRPDGSDNQLIFTDYAPISNPRIYDHKLYYVGHEGDNVDIFSYDLKSGKTEMVAQEENNIYKYELYNGEIYYVSATYNEGDDEITIKRINLDDNRSEDLITAQGNNMTFCMDEKNIYYVEQPSTDKETGFPVEKVYQYNLNKKSKTELTDIKGEGYSGWLSSMFVENNSLYYQLSADDDSGQTRKYDLSQKVSVLLAKDFLENGKDGVLYEEKGEIDWENTTIYRLTGTGKDTVWKDIDTYSEVDIVSNKLIISVNPEEEDSKIYLTDLDGNNRQEINVSSANQVKESNDESVENGNVLDAYNRFLQTSTVGDWKNADVQMANCKFSLIYLDDDDIPELVLFNEEDTSHASGYYQIYTYYDNKVQLVDNTGDAFYYYKEKSVFLWSHTGMGTTEGAFCKVSGLDKHYFLEQSEEIDVDTLETSNGTYYKMDSQEVDFDHMKKINKDEFDKKLKEAVGDAEPTTIDNWYENTSQNREKYLTF